MRQPMHTMDAIGRMLGADVPDGRPRIPLAGRCRAAAAVEALEVRMLLSAGAPGQTEAPPEPGNLSLAAVVRYMNRAQEGPCDDPIGPQQICQQTGQEDHNDPQQTRTQACKYAPEDAEQTQQQAGACEDPAIERIRQRLQDAQQKQDGSCGEDPAGDQNQEQNQGGEAPGDGSGEQNQEQNQGGEAPGDGSGEQNQEQNQGGEAPGDGSGEQNQEQNQGGDGGPDTEPDLTAAAASTSGDSHETQNGAENSTAAAGGGGDQTQANQRENNEAENGSENGDIERDRTRQGAE